MINLEHRRGDVYAAEAEHLLRSSERSMSVGKYSMVFASLVALSGLTFALSFFDLGPWEWPVALGIAAIKSALVADFFMHLVELSPAHSVTGLVAVFMLSVLVLFVLAEVWTRNDDAQAPRACWRGDGRPQGTIARCRVSRTAGTSRTAPAFAARQLLPD